MSHKSNFVDAIVNVKKKKENERGDKWRTLRLAELIRLLTRFFKNLRMRSLLIFQSGSERNIHETSIFITKNFETFRMGQNFLRPISRLKRNKEI